MYFGKSAYRTPQRGMGRSLKRQRVMSAGLLLLLLAVSYSYRLSPDPLDGGGAALIPGGGETTGAFGSGSSSLKVEGGDEELAAFSLPPAEPFRERPEILTQAASKDRTSSLDEDTLTYFLQKVRFEGKGLYEAPPVLSHDRNDTVWAELLADPRKYRGQLVEVKGNIVARDRGRLPLNLRALDIPNPSGADRAFESYLLGVDGKLFLIATLRKQRELEHLDGVRLRGYFCQLYTGDVELPDGTKGKGTVPFLVCDDYQLLERPLVGATSFIPLVCLIVMGVSTVLVVMFLSRRSRKHYEVRRLEARKRAGP
jgi:hypothetical protein